MWNVLGICVSPRLFPSPYSSTSDLAQTFLVHVCVCTHPHTCTAACVQKQELLMVEQQLRKWWLFLPVLLFRRWRWMQQRNEMNGGTALSDNGPRVKQFAWEGSAPCLHKCKPITDSHPERGFCGYCSLQMQDYVLLLGKPNGYME